MNITSKIKKGDKSTVEINAEISAEDFSSYKEKTLKQLGEHVEMKGFRKGTAPNEMIEKQVGDMKVLDEMAQIAVADAYPELIKEHKLEAIGRPSVSITKLASGNPLEFTITTAIVPEITLPDYKKIAKKEMAKKSESEITDKELEEAVMNIRKMRTQNDAIKDGIDPKDTKDLETKELDDEYVKTLGKFKDVAEFTEKLRENLTMEKEQKGKERKQIEIADAILKDAKLEVPEALTNYELQKMTAQMEHDIAMTGMTFDDYLKTIKKTKEELQKDWKEPAEKRAKMNLIIDKIARDEKLEPSTDAVETETKKIMEQHKDSKDIDENNVRAYVTMMLVNQKVFDFFESQK